MTEADPKDEGVTTKEFAEGIEKVNQEILDFAGEESLAHVLRLHYWYATDEMVQVLKKKAWKVCFAEMKATPATI